MLSPMTPRSRVRLYAAAWTAAVAAIPAYMAAGVIAGEWFVPERIPLTLLAIMATGISGYWIGWRMIDPNGDHDSLGALFLGAFICLLAYCLLARMVGLLHYVDPAGMATDEELRYWVELCAEYMLTLPPK